MDHRGARRRISWWPPVLAWLAATSVILITAWAAGWPPFGAERTWSRYDSHLYLSIAAGGYDLFPCRTAKSAGGWCGNAGWFPLYPWIVGGLHRLALPLAPAALAVSWLAYLATLVLLWNAFLVRRSRSTSAAALVFAAFAPGVVYDYAVFPLALLALLTIAFLALLQDSRWLAAGVAAALAALTYPVGIVAAPTGALWLLAQRGAPAAVRARRAVAVVVPSLAALALFAFDQRLETGRWNAYLLVQRKYVHHLQDPLYPIRHAFSLARHDSPFRLASAPALQTTFVAAVLVCVLIELFLHRGSGAPIDTLIALWAVGALLLTQVETNVSVYRGEAALVPLAVLVTRLPRALATVIAVVAVLLSVQMARLFLAGTLL